MLIVSCFLDCVRCIETNGAGNGGAVAGEGVGGVVREDRDGFGIRFG